MDERVCGVLMNDSRKDDDEGGREEEDDDGLFHVLLISLQLSISQFLQLCSRFLVSVNF
jgi:hypothetical protein